MNIIRICGVILFYSGILGGVLLTIYYFFLLFKVSQEEKIKIKDILLVKNKLSNKRKPYLTRSIHYSKILILLIFIGIVLIVLSFLFE